MFKKLLILLIEKHYGQQGCILAPTLFNFYVDIAHTVVMNETDVIDGGPYNLARFNSQKQIKAFRLTSLQYADDYVLVTDKADKLKETIKSLEKLYKDLRTKH